MRPNVPDNMSEWRREDRTLYGKDLFYKYNNDPGRMIFLARTAMVAVGILAGLFVFIVALRFYGPAHAVLALVLFSFCPNMIANAQLATADMTVSCFILLALFTFWLFAEKSSFLFILLAGAALALAQLSKYTSIFLYPLFFLFAAGDVMISRRKDGFILKTFMVFLISLAVTWAGYGFQFEPILFNAMRPEEKIAMAHGIARKLMPFWQSAWDGGIDNFLKNVPVPLSSHILGIFGVFKHGAGGHGTYFMGNWSGSGNPLYYAAAFLIKTPIPALALILAGTLVTLRNKLTRKEVFLIVTALFIFAMASLSKLQLGLRYILPAYPLLFIVASRSVEAAGRFWQKLALTLLLGWYIFTAVITWPDYLSYFNETIGGPANGWKYLRDSNIDWGQDLPALAAYMKERGISEVKLHYFGTAEPSSYGIKGIEFDKADYEAPQGAVYAVSVHWIDHVPWAKTRTPDARLGYSIYVYDTRSDDH
jgi:4-amino-4-deoxy-L-arabinose transferase-like glycosyltransferase